MGKRVAAMSPKAAKVAKTMKGKTAPAAEVATDPLSSVLGFLTEIGLPTTCCQMLQAAAPFALNTPKEQRHSHQTSVVKELADLYAQAEQKCGEDLCKAKAATVEHAEASERARAALEGTTARVATLLADKEAKNKAYEAANEGVAKAKASLQDEQAKATAIAKDKADMEAKQQEFDQAMQADFWKLKNSEFPNKEWRARNKAVAKVLEHLGHAQICEALADALPVALKTAAAERAKFALAAVDAAETAIRDHMAAMTAAIAGFDAPAAEQAKAVAVAEEAVASAEAVARTASQETIDAENVWVEEQGKKDDETAAVSAAAPKAESLAEKVEEASKKLERIAGLLAQFTALAEQSAECPAVADEHPAVEAAPEVPMEVAAAEVPIGMAC